MFPEDRNRILVFLGILACVAIAAFILGMSYTESADDSYSADMPRLIAALRETKDFCEGRAITAKGRPSQHPEMGMGGLLYSDAMAGHNAVITLMITSLQTGMDGDTRKELQTRIRASNSARQSFVDWFYRTPPVAPGGKAEAMVAPNIVGGVAPVLDVLIALHTIASAREAERREVLTHELRDCEWSRWDELGK